MEKHNLIAEFPNQTAKIHDLKISDHHFRKLFDDYDMLEHDIHRIETGAEVSSDQFLTDLRKKRLHLKDQIADYLL
jgi:uncharacterized protein